ncbi:MAG: aspartate--ammonia ligase [Bacillota bacterium]
MYQSKLSVMETEAAIKMIKETFEENLSGALNLKRVSAPILVEGASGINDSLTGDEDPLSFNHGQANIEIVQSLAKWKRWALYYYGFKPSKGLYTNMNAIRPSERLDATHSLYVDQWDWEKTMRKTDRNLDFLRGEVEKIHASMKATETALIKAFPSLKPKLPKTLYFIDSETLRAKYPGKSPEARETLIVKEKKAVFIERIGETLPDGTKHDTRSPDYDDWTLNGDLIVWHEENQSALELSSMGIRVDKERLKVQLDHFDHWKTGKFHDLVLSETLPYSIGGGIGQSRFCQFLLEKRHIGEVQASYWPDTIHEECKNKNIPLL